MTAFSSDASAALAGPDWLRTRRAAALDRLTATALPSPEEELWRYSRVAELDLDRYRPAVEAPTGDAALPAEVRDVPRSALLVVRNGHLVSVEGGAPGLEVGPLSELDPSGETLGAVGGDAVDAFASLHDEFVPDPVLVRVARGAVVPDPVVVVSLVEGDGTAAFPRLVVSAGEDSELTVYGHAASAPAVDALVVPVVELDAGPASRLRYVDVQLLGQSVWQLGHQASRVGRDADLSTTMVALGGDYARLRIDSALDGKGGSGEMLAVYFGEGTQMHDVRTLQDHAAPNTTSNLLFKGVVQGTSHAVWSGLIHIGKEAAGVNAFQTNRNVKLSDGAWAESVPNLEIENNDVHCSHASAVGPVDPDSLFYLESRGVPPAAAERLIVMGFFEEVLKRLPVPGVVAPLRGGRPQARPAGGVVRERLCGVGDVQDALPVRFEVGAHRICLVRLGDDFYAIGDTCSHADVSLSEGEVDADTKHIECWKHGSCFSLETGVPDVLPATRPVPVYRVSVEGDDVLVEVDG